MARVAIDIDSTLHHYWPILERVARERYGVKIPYEDQRGWGIDTLERDQMVACVEETHSDENILTAEPYPGAVEAVGAWHGDGHFIHVTSHRAERTRAATVEWLERIGLPYDDLHLSFDKVARCVEIGIDVLIDDSPVNIERARGHGIVTATLSHPWTDQLAAEGVIVAADWPGLRRRLEPVLNGA